MFVHTYVRTYVHTCTCMCVRMYVCINIHVHMYVHTYIRAYTYIFVCEGVKRLKKFQEEFAELEKERQELVNAEKLFDLPITLYSDLIAVDGSLQGMSKVFELYEAQRVCIIRFIMLYMRAY